MSRLKNVYNEFVDKKEKNKILINERIEITKENRKKKTYLINFATVAAVMLIAIAYFLNNNSNNVLKDPTQNEKLVKNEYVAYVKINPLIKLDYEVFCKEKSEYCEEPIVVSYELQNDKAKEIFKDVNLIAESNKFNDVLILITNVVEASGIEARLMQIHSTWTGLSAYVDEKGNKLDTTWTYSVWVADNQKELNELIKQVESELPDGVTATEKQKNQIAGWKQIQQQTGDKCEGMGGNLATKDAYLKCVNDKIALYQPIVQSIKDGIINSEADIFNQQKKIKEHEDGIKEYQDRLATEPLQEWLPDGHACFGKVCYSNHENYKEAIKSEEMHIAELNELIKQIQNNVEVSKIELKEAQKLLNIFLELKKTIK